MLGEPEPPTNKPVRVNWVFLLQWVIISIVLIPAIMVAAIIFGQPEIIPFNPVARTVLGGIVLGLLISCLHWISLRAYLPQAGWWILATVDGFAASFILSYLVSRLAFSETVARAHLVSFGSEATRWETIFLILLSSALILLPPGIWQWLILKQRFFSRAGCWLPAWLLGGTGTMGIFLIPTLLTSLSTEATSTLTTSITQVGLIIIGSGTFLGTITGIPFLFFLNQTRPGSEPQPRQGFSTRTALFLAAGLSLILPVDLVLLGLMSRPALLFYEDFEDAKRNATYPSCENSSFPQGHLRIVTTQSFTGCDISLSGTYEDFTFVSSLFPVGLSQDGSINLIFRDSYLGWYEIQFRPAREQIHVMKVIHQNDQDASHDLTAGWISTPEIKYTAGENELKLVARGKFFTLWFNGTRVGSFEDHDSQPLISGAIHVGAGAAKAKAIGFEYDNILIWNP